MVLAIFTSESLLVAMLDYRAQTDETTQPRL